MSCPHCGQEMAEGTIYCSWCGQDVTQDASIDSVGIKRPRPITAAAIICAVLGGLSLLGALVFSFASGFLARAPIELPPLPLFGVLTLGRALAIAILSVLFGVIYIMSSGLLLKLRKSGGVIGLAAGSLGIVFSALGLAGAFASPSIIGIAGIVPGLALIVLIVLARNELS